MKKSNKQASILSAFTTLSKYCKILQVFNASHNAIKHIESAMFTDFTELRILDLGNNQINRLTDKTFDSVTILESIKLNNNSLMSIDDAVFSGLKLKILDLSINHLSSDNFLWAPSIGIEYLNLTFNEYKLLNASVLENIVTDFWGEMKILSKDLKNEIYLGVRTSTLSWFVQLQT